MIEPEVEREVVSGPSGHAHERKIVLHGNGGNQSLRAVPAGHPQAIGTPRDGVPGELGQVEAMVQHHGLDSEGGCQLHQSERLDLAAARPRIAQQDSV